MKSFLKNSSVTFEFIVVMTIAFGLFVASSFLDYFSLGTRKVQINDGSLLRIILTELVLGGVLFLYLKLRGWSRADFNLKFTWVEIVDGLLLLLASYCVLILAALVASQFLDLKVLETVKLKAQVSFVVSIALSFVNALYEEVFVAAYVINTLEKYQGALIAVFGSALIRMSYHVYQGPPAVIQILPIGFLFGYVYWRSKRLWPLVLAHALIDIVSLNVRS